MKYLTNDTGTGYIINGILQGIKMGFQKVAKDIIQEKYNEVKKEMGKI